MRKANAFFLFTFLSRLLYFFISVLFFLLSSSSLIWLSDTQQTSWFSDVFLFCAQFQFPCAIVRFEIYSEPLYRLRFLIIVRISSLISLPRLFFCVRVVQKKGIFNLQQSALLFDLCGMCYCEREHSQLNAVHLQANELFSFWCMVSFHLLILGQVWHFTKIFKSFPVA